MKTTNHIATVLLIAGMFASNNLTAQNSSSDFVVSTNTETIEMASPENSCSEYFCFKPNAGAAMLSVDQQVKSIRLNCSIPQNTYSATLLIQDFNGRTLQSINLDTRGKNNSEYAVNDFLAGTYNYTLILNNQKSIYGHFEVED